MFPPEQVSKLPLNKRNGQEKSRFFANPLSPSFFPLRFCLRQRSLEHVRLENLATALSNLAKAIAEVDALISQMQAHRDPLASHIYCARRAYRNLRDTKSGKRHTLSARMSWQRACELGFKGTLADWERLIAAGD